MTYLVHAFFFALPFILEGKESGHRFALELQYNALDILWDLPAIVSTLYLNCNLLKQIRTNKARISERLG